MPELNWKSVNGYIIGRSHVKYGEPCQDRALDFDNGSLRGIVLCDGAGSCKHSEQGAIAVTNAIANVTADQFDEWYQAEDTALLMEAYVLSVLEQEVQKIEGSTLLDFSCTLLTVLVKGAQYIAAHVGDGVICQRINHELSVLSHPENGRYANETYFVTMSPLADHFRVYKGEIDVPHDFMAMSDGASISFYINSKKMMEKENTTMLFEHLVENPVDVVKEELEEFLVVLQNNTTDDCALAILVSHTDMTVYEEEEASEETAQSSSALDQQQTTALIEDESKGASREDDLFEDDFDCYDDFEDVDYEEEDIPIFEEIDHDIILEPLDEVHPRRSQNRNTAQKTLQASYKIDSSTKAAGNEATQKKTYPKIRPTSKTAKQTMINKLKVINILK